MNRTDDELIEAHWRGEIVCVFVVALHLCWLGTASAGSPRIAVIGDEATAVAADLAFDALSKSDRWELVERQRLDAVLKEQKLAASGWTAAAALKLGQLVKADGVLLLVGQAAKDKQTMAVRLVAVNPGVILWSLHQPLPLENVDDWQTTIRSRIEAALPKLSVLAADAVPLSVVSVTSGVKRRDFLRIEGELRQLLIHRLTHEPSLFVLERQQLELLDREKSQPGPENPLAEQPFWTGRHLIEAELNQDLNDGTKLDVTVTLTRPGQQQPKRLAATGRSDQLSALAEDLVKQIVRTLDREPTGAAWPAKAEAERFFQTARWIHENSHFGTVNVWEAVEAAWALGLRTDDIFTWRVNRLLSKSYERDTKDVLGTIALLEDAARFALERPLAKQTYYRLHDDDPVGMLAANHLSSRIASLTEYRPTPKYANELVELRRLTRELYTKVADSPEWRKGTSGEERLEYAWTWTERPADTVAVYRQLLAADAKPDGILLSWRLRQAFQPVSANWHGATPEEVTTILQIFIDELCQSADSENQLTGYRAALRLAGEGEPLEKAERAFDDAVWKLRAKFVSGRLSRDYLAWAATNRVRSNHELFLKLLVAFSERKDCNVDSLMFVVCECTERWKERTPEQTKIVHAALRRVSVRNLGGYDGNRIRQALRELEEQHPELDLAAETPKTVGGVTISRIGWPKLSDAATDAPQGIFEGEYKSATWHEDRVWCIATVDGRIGVFAWKPATNASEFIPLPRQTAYRQPNFMQLHVADDAVVVALDSADATDKEGVFRFHRAAKSWRAYGAGHGLSSTVSKFGLPRIGNRIFSRFANLLTGNQSGKVTAVFVDGVLDIDLDSGTARPLVDTHRRQSQSPFDDPSLVVDCLLAGPHDRLYLRAAVPNPDGPWHSPTAQSYSPKDGTWREIKPSDWQEAERLAPQRRVLSAFGGVVHNWPGTKSGPQYWADDRDSWYGQPTRAILYGDETTGSIVSIPVSLTLDGDFGRRHLPDAAKLTDAAIARRVDDTASAWLLTPGGVLFSGPKQPFWWFVEADEIRRAAHAQAKAAAITSVTFQQPLVLSEHKPGRKKQLQAATADGKTAPWLRSIWNDRQPTVSPDGKRVAFVSDRLDNDDILLINADGSGLKNLTDSWADDSEPKFSADGKRLSFRSTHRGNTETRTIDLP